MLPRLSPRRACCASRIRAKANPPARLRQDCLGGPTRMRIAGPGDSTRVAMTCSKYLITSPSPRTYLDVSGEHTSLCNLKNWKGKHKAAHLQEMHRPLQVRWSHRCRVTRQRRRHGSLATSPSPEVSPRAVKSSSSLEQKRQVDFLCAGNGGSLVDAPRMLCSAMKYRNNPDFCRRSWSLNLPPTSPGMGIPPYRRCC